MTSDILDIEQVARVAYEANRTLLLEMGEEISPPFNTASYLQINEVIQRVTNYLAGQTSEDYHKSWVARKRDKGWVYGPALNNAAKTHPNMVNYHDLPSDQRLKDHMFETIVKAFKEGHEADD